MNAFFALPDKGSLYHRTIFYFFSLNWKKNLAHPKRSMKKTFSFLYLLLSINLAVMGQQDPQFTNHMFYKLGVNPGYAGAENAVSGIILNRYQWEGMKGAPKTLVFSADAAGNLFGISSGFGLNIVSDELGFANNIQINGIYSFKTDLSIGTLGVGISVGLYNQSINGEWESPEDPVYTPPVSDPGIPQGEVSQMALDFGGGLYLSSNQYFVGVSVTHINQAPINYDDYARAYLSRHYYFNGGYNIKLADPLFELRPSFLFKSDLAGWQLEANANVVYDDRLWGGISYRIDDAVALLMGIELINGLKVGYSFDLVTSAIGYYGFASHEIFISYSVNLDRNRKQKYKSIRFL